LCAGNRNCNDCTENVLPSHKILVVWDLCIIFVQHAESTWFKGGCDVDQNRVQRLLYLPAAFCYQRDTKDRTLYVVRMRAVSEPNSCIILQLYESTMGCAIVQLDEVLCYKSEGRGFDSQWCHLDFSLT
jgi:hypothetical protein